MKYLITLGALVLVAVGYFWVVSNGSVPVVTTPVEPDPESPAAPSVPAATGQTVSSGVSSSVADEEAFLKALAADARESLPSSVTVSLAITDARFLPRMRIMEYTFVTSAENARATANDMRTLIETGAGTICVDGRAMFGMGVTLRNSLEDRAGNIVQRVYLLPEECQQFYQ